MRRPSTHRLPCHPVEGFLPRLRGLIGHPSPAPGTGWWFTRCQSVHTLAMRYPIDVVFLSVDGTILRIASCLPPSRARWQRGASEVVEMAAGEAQRLGLRQGDRLLPQRMAR